MRGHEPPGGHPPPDPQRLYAALLGEAGVVAVAALDRLRRLAERFPEVVPGSLVEALARAHADPAAERRAAVRLAGDRVRAAVGVRRSELVLADVLDACPGGLALRLGRPVPAGAVLPVQVQGWSGWAAAEVRHCRADEGGWVAGCRLLGPSAG